MAPEIQHRLEAPVKTTVLGSGGMGTACAVLLAEHPGQEVSIWARRPELAEEMTVSRRNSAHLPQITLSASISATADIAVAVRDAEFLVMAIPSRHLRATLETLKPALRTNIPIISVVKGIEIDTLQRPSEVIQNVLGPRTVLSLTGPSHAEEIANRLPASVVAACEDLAVGKRVQELFSTDRFRIYTNTDLVGAELAGALKNVIGIAAGISDGLGYGDNAKSALMTRGIVEMGRFGARLGAAPETFSGLAGIGDLITTCMSPHGRNRQVGFRLGQGESLDQILNSMNSVAEGVTTAKAVYHLSQRVGIDMPITTEVYRVLFEGKSPEEATNSLMNRPYRGE
ncbi:MAG: NAD(P)-dependent glycerol-3-phosphate dehydrogenase [Planctomycetaceae bacterium]|nr:NAD(P)-dependent glycerol-3-phosphate dehydrogenase [Planctomycetaceae bacterium]